MPAMPASGVELLCLPCAGASATMYLRWRRQLPAWLRVQPVELPGRGSRLDEPSATDFDTLVAQLCAEQQAAMRGRCVLLGHSMGALLAYGMALRQQQAGAPMPLALVVSASPAPGARDPARFENLQGDEALMADLRRQGGTPEEVFAHAELRRMTLDVLAADYAVCQSFELALQQAAQPLPRLSLPLQVLAGRQDDISADAVEAWLQVSTGPASVDWFDGGHFFIRQQEAQTLACLTRSLARFAPGADHATPAFA
ncbi:thioesterase II family protein [Ideonella sp.]|uniref:thioesterase II family protein n=2 Tax=Ideonella sp. TaxID=1929293 RepID=UPI00351AC4EE